jgi:hypothetical protein
MKRWFEWMSVCAAVLALAGCATAGTPPATALPGNSPLSSPSPATTSIPSEPAPATPAATNRPATAQPRPTGQQPSVVDLVKQVLVQQLHAPADQVKVVSVEEVEWPDGCLGVHKPDIMCAQIITAGYRVILEFNGKRYEYHTDKDASQIVLADTPAPQGQAVAIAWERTEQGQCQTARIGASTVAFGPCGGALTAAPFVMPERAATVAEFVKTYAPFTAETPAGKVTFTGRGSQVATPAEQRMIAEFAKLVDLEAMGGRGGAAYGLALAWHREGGVAGFCDDVTVYLTGDVYASSCKGGTATNLGVKRLNAQQLAQLYEWVDGLKNFEFEHTDPATADAMTIRMVFTGSGAAEASDSDKQAMQDFASHLAFQPQSAWMGTGVQPRLGYAMFLTRSKASRRCTNAA